MKAFAFVLLCALAAVQGRYHGLQSTGSAAALGENPYVVHLRIAVSTSGLLKTCIGSLIANSWVLTSASCIYDARFIWVRYGAVNVIHPSLVTEASIIRTHPDSNIGLINLNRHVEWTKTISDISPLGKVSTSGKVCTYGGGEDGPGEQLNCYKVAVEQKDGNLTVSSDEVVATSYDVGAPLVSDGAQFGILVGAGSDGKVGDFLATAPFAEWLEQETGVNFSSDVAPEAVSFVQ